MPSFVYFYRIVDASMFMMLLGGAANSSGNTGTGPAANTNTMDNFLEQYTEQLLKRLEEKMSQNKPDPGAK